MRIGIDCRTMLNPQAGERAGVGHYTTYLVKELVKLSRKDTFVLFFDHRMPNNDLVKWLRELSNVEIVKFPLSEYKKYLPYGYSHVVVAQTLKQKNLDIFHSPAYAIPMQYNRPSIITVHDLAIYRNASWFPPKQKFSTRVLVPSSIRKATQIIAVSQATAKQVKQYFKIPQKHVQVIYEGFSKEERLNKEKREHIKRKFTLNDRFIFFVGTIEPRKNLVNLVRAFDHFMDENYKRHQDIQLVIAGGKGWKHQQIFRTIARAKWSANIRVIGYISHEEKIALLESSLFFAFPSHWEGFGLPILEAASLGVPILTSKISSLPEVADGGAIYVQPNSVSSIQKGITTLVRSAAQRKSLGSKGKLHAKNFSWKKCAKETHQLYEKVMHDQEQLQQEQADMKNASKKGASKNSTKELQTTKTKAVKKK